MTGQKRGQIEQIFGVVHHEQPIAMRGKPLPHGLECGLLIGLRGDGQHERGRKRGQLRREVGGRVSAYPGHKRVLGLVQTDVLRRRLRFAHAAHAVEGDGERGVWVIGGLQSRMQVLQFPLTSRKEGRGRGRVIYQPLRRRDGIRRGGYEGSASAALSLMQMATHSASRFAFISASGRAGSLAHCRAASGVSL